MRRFHVAARILSERELWPHPLLLLLHATTQDGKQKASVLNSSKSGISTIHQSLLAWPAGGRQSGEEQSHFLYLTLLWTAGVPQTSGEIILSFWPSGTQSVYCAVFYHSVFAYIEAALPVMPRTPKSGREAACWYLSSSQCHKWFHSFPLACWVFRDHTGGRSQSNSPFWSYSFVVRAQVRNLKHGRACFPPLSTAKGA